MKRCAFLLTLLLLPTLLAAMGRTDDSGDGIRVDSDGYAVDGYDVVAFTELPADVPAIRGTPAYSWEWRGATWLFSSNENLQRFKGAPREWIPEYGGYGAAAMAEGKLTTSNPDAWDIYEGKLYLFRSTAVRNEWRADPEAMIAAANVFWPDQLRQLRNR